MLIALLLALILLVNGYIFTFNTSYDFYLLIILGIYLIIIDKLKWKQSKSLMLIDYLLSLSCLISYYLLFKKEFILSNFLYLYLICFICNALIVNRRRFMYLLGKNN